MAAVVTGAGSGIGRAIAIRLAQRGQPVLVVDLLEKSGQQTVDLIHRTGGIASLLLGDVAQESFWTKIVSTATTEYQTLRTLIHNAGIGGPMTFEDTTLEAWQRVLAVNQTAVFIGCKHAKHALIEAAQQGHDPSIVILASVCSTTGGHGELPSYYATKGAVIQMTRNMAVAFGDCGIRINAVSPGYIDTPLIKNMPDDLRQSILRSTPLRRLGTPEEVASAVAWLSSEEAAYVTGANLFVDGGYICAK